MRYDLNAKDLFSLLPDARNISKTPEHMRDGLYRWISLGIRPGGFLTAVLSNDLKEAVGRADDINRWCLPEYVMFLFNDAPGGCWGSPDKVVAWAKAGGLAGMERKADDESA